MAGKGAVNLVIASDSGIHDVVLENIDYDVACGIGWWLTNAMGCPPDERPHPDIQDYETGRALTHIFGGGNNLKEQEKVYDALDAYYLSQHDQRMTRVCQWWYRQERTK